MPGFWVDSDIDRALKADGIPPTGRMVYFCLVSFIAVDGPEKGWAWPSNATLGRRLGEKERTVRRWLGVLEAKGWLESMHRGRGRKRRTTKKQDLACGKHNTLDVNNGHERTGTMATNGHPPWPQVATEIHIENHTNENKKGESLQNTRKGKPAMDYEAFQRTEGARARAKHNAFLASLPDAKAEEPTPAPSTVFWGQLGALCPELETLLRGKTEPQQVNGHIEIAVDRRTKEALASRLQNARAGQMLARAAHKAYGKKSVMIVERGSHGKKAAI